MNEPLYTVLYDIAKTIVTTIAPVKDRIGAGHLAEGAVIEDVRDVLTKRLREAGFVRIEQIPG